MRTALAILAEIEGKAAAPEAATPKAAPPKAAAPKAPASEAAAPKAAPPDIAKVAKPAPGASPVGAFAFMAGDDGTQAWLVKDGDKTVGYLRDTAQPDRAIEVDDAQAWAQIVDQLGLTEQAVPTADAPPADQAPPAAQQAAPAADPAASAPADPAAPPAPAAPADAAGAGTIFDGQNQAAPAKPKAPVKPQGKAAPAGGTATPADYEEQTGIMIAFVVPEGDARDLVIDHPTALRADQLHVTLAFLGTTDEVDDEGAFYTSVLESLRDVGAEFDPLSATISGVGRFTIPGDADAFYYSVDAPELPELRQGIVEALEENGLDVSREHGFTPHITVAYVKEGEDSPLRRAAPKVLNFDSLVFFYGDQRVTVRLGGKDPEEDDAEFAPELGRPGYVDSTAPSAMPDGKGANLFAKNGKNKIGKRGGVPIATGAWVSWGNQRGRVDLVVTNGKVPGVEQDITGSKDKPAARVVVYEQGAGKKWKATGKKVGVSASSLKRSFPLTGGFGKKGLDDDGEAGIVGLLTDYYQAVEGKDLPRVDPAAVQAAYERGVTSWPGDTSWPGGVEAVAQEAWALGRTKAFLTLASGEEVPGYHHDFDLLPEAHPLAVKVAAAPVVEVREVVNDGEPERVLSPEQTERLAEGKVAMTIATGEHVDGDMVRSTIDELLRFARPSA